MPKPQLVAVLGTIPDHHKLTSAFEVGLMFDIGPLHVILLPTVLPKLFLCLLAGRWRNARASVRFGQIVPSIPMQLLPAVMPMCLAVRGESPSGDLKLQ